MGLPAHNQDRDQERQEAATCTLKLVAFIHDPPGIARDKVHAQARNIRGLGPQTCSSEPGVYKVLMCDILWGRPKGSRAMSLDPDSSRRILLWEGRA